MSKPDTNEKIEQLPNVNVEEVINKTQESVDIDKNKIDLDLDSDLTEEEKKQLKKLDFQLDLKADIDDEKSKPEKKTYHYEPLSMQEQMKNYSHKEEIAKLNLELVELQNQFNNLKNEIKDKKLSESDPETMKKINEMGKQFTEVGKQITRITQDNKIFLLKSYLKVPEKDALRIRSKDIDRIIKLCERKEQRLFY